MNVLIIKTGLVETFDPFPRNENIVSLGDVLRTTPILHLFADENVFWFTREEALPLLIGQPRIKKVCTDFTELSGVNFDTIINLERSDYWADQFADFKGKFFGFRKIKGQMIFQGERIEEDLFRWMGRPEIKGLNWSEKLFLLFGKKWQNENYLLPQHLLNHSNENTFDVGFNWKVGAKWPTKSWPRENWEELEKRLTPSLRISWQEGFDDLIHYMNWIHACRTIVTHDSLGMHIARALNKNMIALFGPTSSHEVDLGKGAALSESEIPSFSCPPCYRDSCHNIIHCMKSLSVDKVEDGLRSILKGN